MSTIVIVLSKHQINIELNVRRTKLFLLLIHWQSSKAKINLRKISWYRKIRWSKVYENSGPKCSDGSLTCYKQSFLLKEQPWRRNVANWLNKKFPSYEEKQSNHGVNHISKKTKFLFIHLNTTESCLHKETMNDVHELRNTFMSIKSYEATMVLTTWCIQHICIKVLATN